MMADQEWEVTFDGPPIIVRASTAFEAVELGQAQMHSALASAPWYSFRAIPRADMRCGCVFVGAERDTTHCEQHGPAAQEALREAARRRAQQPLPWAPPPHLMQQAPVAGEPFQPVEGDEGESI